VLVLFLIARACLSKTVSDHDQRQDKP
jgi:hypothetical protein